MMETYKANCGIVAEVLAAHGVTHAVCSPGSRNAPMLLAMDHHPEISTHVIIDERAAAFFALGLAQVTRQPVALVCTSGTAVLNYAPAVAEAYYQGLPLIVVSADRPQQWIDQDDSQTIRQPGVLANFVKKSFDIPDIPADNKALLAYIDREVNDAMIEATSRRCGPVHINLRLEEPLTPEKITLHPSRTITCLEGDDILPKEQVRELAREAAGKRVLIVAGFMLPDARLNRSMALLSSLPNVYIMHETLANIHLNGRHSAIDTILSTLSEGRKKTLAPDLVITVGGALVSRLVKEYIRSLQGISHWSIGHHHTTVDCFNALTTRIEANPGRFLSMLGKFMAKEKPRSNYSVLWDEVRRQAINGHEAFLRQAPWSDLKACQIILDALPRECNLQLSNGTSVRYAQLCMAKMPHACYCNRGVSGIDGSVSTAIGAALTYPETTVLLTGDMSMAYDIGALALPEITERLKIIVLNNQGGGIFRFIGSTRNLSERERYFCAPPRLPLATLAEAYGFEYYSASDAAHLEKVLPIFLSPRLSPAILEITTPGMNGGDVLRQYMNRGLDYGQQYAQPANGCLFPLPDELSLI